MLCSVMLFTTIFLPNCSGMGKFNAFRTARNRFTFFTIKSEGRHADGILIDIYRELPD